MGRVKTFNYKNTEEYKRIEQAFPDKTPSELFDIYEYDVGKRDNDFADLIEKQIEERKKAPLEKRSSLDKVRNMKAKKVVDSSKQSVIDFFFNNVKSAPFVEKAQEMTGTKMSFKDDQGNYYSVAITRHKKKPDGFKED